MFLIRKNVNSVKTFKCKLFPKMVSTQGKYYLCIKDRKITEYLLQNLVQSSKLNKTK